MNRDLHEILRLAGATPRYADHILSESAISDAEFWKFVAEAGWAESNDNKAISKRLFAKYGKAKMEEYRAAFDKLESALDKAIVRWEKASKKKLPLGDDGYSDLKAHIIGLGKKEYDTVLKDPSLAYSRAEAGSFKESFAYIFQPPIERAAPVDTFDPNTVENQIEQMIEYSDNAAQTLRNASFEVSLLKGANVPDELMKALKDYNQTLNQLASSIDALNAKALKIRSLAAKAK